jgi:four helix bundle protein
MKNKIEKFEDLNVWQEAMELSKDIYQNFAECNDFGFSDQIRRAAVSIPSNIAEGFDRQTNKELIQFLFIAKGSVAELRTQLYLAIAFNYVDKTTGLELLEDTRKISAMLFRWIQVRKTKFK